MKKILFSPLLYLLLIIGIFYIPFLIQGKVPIPADTIIGLYHPYRDLYAKNYPNGIPFKNSLITDPVRQQYPWQYFEIHELKKGKLPTWNPYAMSGTPFLANFQSAVFYPLNLLFFILPFSVGWGMLIMLQTVLAALFMYFYLEDLRLDKWAAAFGGLIFAFSGFAIAWLEWGGILQTLLWLPLILLAVEKLLKKYSWKWTVILLISEISAFFAGHLQTFIYVFILANIYIFVRIFQEVKGKNNMLKDVNNYSPFLYITIVFILITSIQWFPTLQYILHSARNSDLISNWTKDGWFIPWQNLIQFLAPDFFGNPATGNYFGIWNYGEFIGYIGIIPLGFVLYMIFQKKTDQIRFFLLSLIISLFFALPTFVGKLPYIFSVPFFSTAQPTRLLSIIDFSLAVLAAWGLHSYLLNKQKKVLISFISILLIFLIALLVANHSISKEQWKIVKHNSILPLGILLLGSLLVGASLLIKQVKIFRFMILLLILLSAFDLLRFAQKFIPFTSTQYLYPQTTTTTFLKENLKYFRFMSVDDSIIPPNFSLMYQIQSVEGYDPLYLNDYGSYMATIVRGKPDIKGPYGFNRIVNIDSAESRLVDLLGVKYVLSLSDIHSPKLKQVMSEGLTKVYENTQVMQRVFFVTNIIQTKQATDTIQKLYDPQLDLRKTAVIEDSVNKNYFDQGHAEIIDYAPDEVQIGTQNNREGFLVFTDIYYPTWHVYIDGKVGKLYKTDYLFRGVIVPPGNHAIVFKNNLL